MDPALASAATAVLVEGVKFLYQQAGEILTSWRARRRDKAAGAPKALPAPEGVTVGQADPVPDAPSNEVLELLQELKDLVEPIKDGAISVEEPAAREAVDKLRELVESVLRAPVRLGREAPRPGVIADVEVVTKQVAGEVVGVRTRLAEVRGVKVETGDVEAGGKVTGVDQG